MANKWHKGLHVMVREHLDALMTRMDNLMAEEQQRGELTDEDRRTFAEWKTMIFTWRREIDRKTRNEKRS